MPQTGATRYQKFLKSEKAKTKLKGKKDLPKGTNVTKTDFKIKKIIIREQLRVHGDKEALSKRKLSLKELLGKLSHFNTKARTDSLEGLRELLTNHPEILEQNIGQIIQQVTPLVLDVEKVVRIESLKYLHLVLSNTTQDKLEPFFDIMCTYLRSAMTHIDTRIQEDSLLFLDVLLLCCPNRVAKEFHKIIPNFMDMISKLKMDSNIGRTLTVNLDSQLTSVRWRVKVLNRLKDFLAKFLELSNESKVKNDTKIIQYFQENAPNIFPLSKDKFLKNGNFTCFSSKKEESGQLSETESLQKYIEALIPLLLETWIEAGPSGNKKCTIDTVLSEETAALLQHTLEVIYLLWQYIKLVHLNDSSHQTKKYFIQKIQQPFTKHFVYFFPYITNVRHQKKKNSKLPVTIQSSITDPKMIKENLKICYLFAVFNANINMKLQNEVASTVINYLENTFIQNMDEELNTEILKVIDCLFSDNMVGWTRSLSKLEPLLNSLINAYFNTSLPSSIHHSIFSLLCKISLNPNLVSFHKTESYQCWLLNLPDIMTGETISIQAIDILHKFAIQNNHGFNQVVKPKFEHIIKNLPKIIIIDGTIQDLMKLLSLLYRIDGWTNNCLNVLENLLLEGAFDNFQSKFIMDILQLKSTSKFN